jgi:hypothetical protein
MMYRIWDKHYEEFTKLPIYASYDRTVKSYVWVNGGYLELDQDQFIVQQCTGLKDLEGRYLYEGDKVDYYGDLRVVKYDDDMSISFFNKEGQHRTDLSDIVLNKVINCTITGNIMEVK